MSPNEERRPTPEAAPLPTPDSPAKDHRFDSIGQLEDIRRFADHLYGGNTGTAHIAIGSEPHLNESGKYNHRHWDQHTFAWPDERDLLAKEMAARRCGFRCIHVHRTDAWR